MSYVIKWSILWTFIDCNCHGMLPVGFSEEKSLFQIAHVTTQPLGT